MLKKLNESAGSKEVLGSDYDYLRLTKRPRKNLSSRTVRTVDLFAGCGGTALGLEAACDALGLRSEIA